MTSRVGDDFWSHVDRGAPDQCWPWKRGKGRTYGTVWLPDQGRSKGSHVIAWEATHGSVPDGLQVLHRCDNRPCCNPEHLFLGTQSDNMRDAISKGRKTGQKHTTDHDRIEADPDQRPALYGDELQLAATCALSEEMERQDLTKAALAAKMGRTRGDITQILSGSRNLTLRTLAEVADALGCKVTIGIALQHGAAGRSRLAAAAGGRR
jgi:hypothetical protein